MSVRRIPLTGAGMLAGVWLYCLVVAPLFDPRPFGAAAEIGLPFTLVIVVIFAIAAGIPAWRSRRRPKRS